MLLGVLVRPTGVLDDGRRALRRLLLSGQRQVHTSDESHRRRRDLLRVVGALDGVAVVHTFRRPSNVNRVEARRLLLTAAALDVTTRTVVTWVLDSQHEHQAAMDRITLDRARRGLAGAGV